MLLAPDEGQTEIATAVADILLSEAPFDRLYFPDLDIIADEQRLMDLAIPMGWLGMAAPESIGGSAGDLTDECLLFMKLGERIAPLGITAGALAAHAALGAGDETLAAAFVTGDARAALATSARPGRAFATAGATHLLVVEENRISLSVLVTGGDDIVALDASSSTAAVSSADKLLQVDGPELVLRFALLVASQLQGLAQTGRSESNEYAKVREQFGRPIGSFQAVRHRIADMELRARQVEAQIYFAAVALRDGRADAELQTLSALLLAGDAAMANAEINIHNHGAIGTTTENIGHLLLKRAILLTGLAGGANQLKDRIAACAPAIM